MICHLRTTAIAFVLLTAVACQHMNQDHAQGDESGGPASSDTAAIIDGQKVTVGELDGLVKENLFSNATSDGEPRALYEVRSSALKEMIEDRAVENAASAAELSTEEFLTQQLEASGGVSEEDIVAFYTENESRMSKDGLDHWRDRIGKYLMEQRILQIVADLRDQSDAQILLARPRVQVDAIGPSKGPDDAIVTIVEFSDFRCPYCKRVVPTLDQVLDRYPTQVRLVFRNLPLGIHPRAVPIAEAAACADKQGNFWGYHDLIFANKSTKDEDLDRFAAELGLEMQAFRQCVQNRETQQIVEADTAAAEGLRITGTPSFAINGIPLHGAKSFEDFTEIIDEEIAQNAATESDVAR
jgi:protein-disulfide isomerase